MRTWKKKPVSKNHKHLSFPKKTLRIDKRRDINRIISMYKGDRCDERITRAASIVSGCTWPLIFPNSRPFLPFRPFFGTQGQVPANGTGSFNTCRSFLRVCPSHFTFRRVSRRRLSPLPQLGSFSSRVLRACPPEWRSERRRKRRTVHGKSEMHSFKFLI